MMMIMVILMVMMIMMTVMLILTELRDTVLLQKDVFHEKQNCAQDAEDLMHDSYRFFLLTRCKNKIYSSDGFL